ncbi:MAG: hypothetical protein ACI96W_002254 [Paraglaciecola sp.]|jgi:hypothetical protein
MRFIILLIALFALPAQAQDCLGESEVFFNIVAAKWAVNTGIANDPDSFDGEKWLYIWGGAGSIFEEKKISDKTAKAMARLVAENDFSENPEVEVNIFEDYWYLSCKTKINGGSVNPLKDIAKDSLIDCWNAASSREDFQSCLTPLVNES